MGFISMISFACMLCGLGFDAKVAHDFAQQPKRGLTTYVKLVVKNFFSAQNLPFRITITEYKHFKPMLISSVLPTATIWK